LVYVVGAVGDCQKLQIAIGITFAISVPSTALLFYFRIKAIFNNNLGISVFFGFLWLATLAGSITVPFAIEGGHIGPTDHCINTAVKPFSSTGIVISTVNDTLVFVFITWRLLSATTYDESLQGRARAFFEGKGLPAFSRAILQGGQQYYMQACLSAPFQRGFKSLFL
jgi:hypothetical protein